MVAWPWSFRNRIRWSHYRSIDRYGEKFSQKKQDQVLNFKKLIMVKNMKSFLRVIGQLREHVEIISVI